MNAPEKPRGKTKFDTIGKPRRRVDGRAKAIGQLRFADDLSLPRMLHCKLLRSPHPHAVIESIDIARAEAHPGVHLVLTGAAFPIPYGIMPVSLDEHPLARDKVRFVGDPVAAVVAIDEHPAVEPDAGALVSRGTVAHGGLLRARRGVGALGRGFVDLRGADPRRHRPGAVRFRLAEHHRRGA